MLSLFATGQRTSEQRLENAWLRWAKSFAGSYRIFAAKFSDRPRSCVAEVMISLKR
jgi:hypothetical protein